MARHRLRGLVACGIIAATITSQGANAQARAVIKIRAQALSDAVRSLAQQTNTNILFAATDLRGLSTHGVEGKLTPIEAVRHLLDGTALEVVSDGTDGLVIRPRQAALARPAAHQPKSDIGYAVMQPASATLAPSPAEPAASAGEDIVVTAQKRSERLIDVPVSVSVVSSQMLMRLGAQQFRDFAATVPGLTFTTSGAGRTQISLRGVTVGSDFGATVAVYVDDVPYTSSSPFSASYALALDVGVADVDRVEVLRGPQGTLYGASAMGGLVKYVTKQPDLHRITEDVQAGISTTHHGGVGYNGSAAINVPIFEDKVAVRASGFEFHDGGFIDNVGRSAQHADRADIYGGRLDLLFQPSSDLSVRIGGFLQNIDRSGNSAIDVGPDGSLTFGTLGQDRLAAEPFTQRFRLVSGTISYNAGLATLTSISSYMNVDTVDVGDISSDFVPFLAEPPFSRNYRSVAIVPHYRTTRFIQELRLASNGTGPLRWLIGGYYTHDKSTNFQVTEAIDVNGKVAPNDLFTYSVPSIYEEVAAFGNLTWKLTKRLELSGGLRFSRNEQAFEQISAGLLLGDSKPLNKQHSTKVTYLANASYHLGDRATAFLRYATGFRPGGPNILTLDLATGRPLGPTTIEADSTKSYEGGIKAETADHRFGIDGAVYYINWNDIQLTATRNRLATYVNAAGGAGIKGAELSLTARPIADLTLSSALAYQDARLSRADADLRGAKHERLPNVPRFTAAVSADYVFASTWLKPTIGATFRHISNRYARFHNQLDYPLYELPAFSTLDLRAGIELSPVTLQLYFRNATDRRGRQSVSGDFGYSLIQPRTFGINARVALR